MFQHAPSKSIGKRGNPRKGTLKLMFLFFRRKCENRSRESMCDSLCDTRFRKAMGICRKVFLRRSVCVIACVIPLSVKS